MDKFNSAELYEFTHAELVRIKIENTQLKEENEKLKKKLSRKILLVEDGSVDIDQLEEDGFYVIPYRQGSTPPMWLPNQHEDKGE